MLTGMHLSKALGFPQCSNPCRAIFLAIFLAEARIFSGGVGLVVDSDVQVPRGEGGLVPDR